MPSIEQQMGSGQRDDHDLHFIIAFLSIAVFNALDIMLQIFTRFKRYHGVYFYSMLAATIGIILHGLGYVFRTSEGRNHSPPLGVTLACGGGMLMITGQSVVMWSRLHLISPGKKDTWMLYMIVAACIVVQGGATALFAGSNSPNPAAFLQVYRRFEIFQVTWFFAQESLISGIYIYRSYTFLRPAGTFRGPQTKSLFRHLILVNAVVIALDITILAFEGNGLYNLQTSWKTLAY